MSFPASAGKHRGSLSIPAVAQLPQDRPAVTGAAASADAVPFRSHTWAGLPRGDQATLTSASVSAPMAPSFFPRRLCRPIAAHTGHEVDGITAGCVHGTSGRRNPGFVPWTSVPWTYSHSVKTSGSRVLRLRRSTKSKASRRSIIAAYGLVLERLRFPCRIVHQRRDFDHVTVRYLRLMRLPRLAPATIQQGLRSCHAGSIRRTVRPYWGIRRDSRQCDICTKFITPALRQILHGS
jgi:hypothetical protein